MSCVPYYLLVGWRALLFVHPWLVVFVKCWWREKSWPLSAMEGSVNKRLREREETPPPAKKRCTQATPPVPASSKNNGSSNGHDATHTELESLGRNGSARRSSRTSTTSSTTSSPPASPARRGRRGAAGGSSGSDQQPQTPTRSSGRLRQSYHLSFEKVLLVNCHQSLLMYLLLDSKHL